MSRAPPGSDRALFAGLLVVIAWVTLPLGSNRPWSWSLLAALVGLLIASWGIGQVLRPRVLPRSARNPALIAIGAWLAFTLVQLAPLPESLLAGPTVRAFAAANAAGAPTVGRWSLDRAATVHGTLKAAAYAGILLTVLVTVTARQRMRLVLWAMLVVGLAQAAYALFAYFTSDYLDIWYPGRALGRAVSGTYVNRNHLAGLLELTIPAAAGLFAIAMADVRSRGRRRRSLRALDLALGPGAVCAVALLLMFAALLMTTSRGGMAGCTVGLVVAALTAAIGRPGARRTLARCAGLAAIPFVGALWLGTGELGDKLASAGVSSNRPALRAVAYEMIAERPWTGTGAGTFRWVFPAFKDERFGAGFYEHAHNDYLELLIEQGIIGAGLLGAGVAALFAAALAGSLRRHDPVLRGVLFACVWGCTSLLVHGLVDFNLQIPANAALFFVLLGLGAVAAGHPRRAARSSLPDA